MTTATIFKSVLKMAIVILFLTERSWYYNRMKASNSLHLHHEILPGFDVDYKEVDKMYENHQLFNVPLIKPMIEGIKSFVEHHTNLNKSVEHEKHSHLQNILRTFQNKLVDLDIKFEFFFITAYDLLISSFLVIFVFSESLIFNAFLINDTTLKLISLVWAIFKEIKIPLVYDTVYTVIQDFLKRDFVDAWRITRNFFDKEKLLLANMALLGLLSIHFIWVFTQKFSERLSLGQVADIAHDFKDKIEEKMHDLGVGTKREIQKVTSHIEKEGSSPDRDRANLKTMESEGGNNLDSKSESNYTKVPKQPDNKKGPRTPSKRRMDPATL